jgi:hypothetical protein
MAGERMATQTDTVIEVDALRTRQLGVGQLIGVRPEQSDCFQLRANSPNP